MSAPNLGPSGNAWGVPLADPVLVHHDSRLVLFARAAGTAVTTLYFTVFDPSPAADGSAPQWNGWYRYDFPEAAGGTPGVVDDAEPVEPELRLAGMDLITVPPLAAGVAAADAPFRVLSDGAYLAVFRQSVSGRLYLNRLALVAGAETRGGESERRFVLEAAFELRFRRSGLRDVPRDATDTQSFVDPIGVPFLEPTIELPEVTDITGGRFAVASSPTADSTRTVLFVAVITASGTVLHRIVRSELGVVDLAEPPRHYTPLVPSLSAGGAPLDPIAGLAPGLSIYAEHDAATAADGSATELMRGVHLMLAIPVAGGGLTAATAVYDFALDARGDVADLPAADQSLVLVDGTIDGGVFVPDEIAPVFPRPGDLAATSRMIGGLLVTSMALGQVQPHGSPLLTVGDDGLVHLYFGGPLPGQSVYRWASLDPNLPQAMVAQFDARTNRLTLAVPWVIAAPAEQPNGAAEFVALQGGCIMQGATVGVSDPAAPADPAALCDVAIAYPAASGLPAETWRSAPRELGAFMAVLNGEASGKSADPAVLSGDRPFFDFTGTLPLVRVPLAMPAGSVAGPAPVLMFVSTRADLRLTAVAFAAAGAGRDATLSFAADDQPTITVTWRGLAATAGAYGDIFAGVADHATYSYPADTADTPLFALETDARGVPAPLVLYPQPGANNPAAITIEVLASAAGADKVDVRFHTAGGQATTVPGAPAEVAKFVAALKADAGFASLKLGISASGAAGCVALTSTPVGRIGLADTAALFDLLLPPVDLNAAGVPPGSASALVQGHSFTPQGSYDATRMIGFLVRSLLPAAGAPAYVQNSAPGAAATAVTRQLHGTGELRAGGWVRQTPQHSCRFDPGNPAKSSMTVPVVTGGSVRPASVFLRPSWDWTLEIWLKPDASTRQRVVTFLDAATPVAPGAPQLSYALDIEGQEVAAFSSYQKTRGTPDSSYFQTGTSTGGSFMPSGAFTWEFWLNPDAAAGPPPGGQGPPPLGGILQIGQAGRAPVLTIGLTADRHVVIETLDDNSNVTRTTTAGVVPATDASGGSQWSHVAIVGTQDGASKKWSMRLFIDGLQADAVANLALQSQGAAFLVIGANTPNNASVFGRLAQLRYWSIARSAAEIRRTFFASLTGREPGLLGAWPLTDLESGPGGQRIARNIARVTGTFWDAALNAFPKQTVSLVKDSFFLSVIAEVAGLPRVEADALLANGRWNHVAMVYRAGGAIAFNAPSEFDAGRYNWIVAGEAESLGPSPNFALDAWIQIAPGIAEVIGTIAARWSDDQDPDDQCYRFWGDDAGGLRFDIAVITDIDGTVTTASAKSLGVDLRDGRAHHVAAAFSSVSANPNQNTKASYTITLYMDGAVVGSTDSGGLDDIGSIMVRTSQTDVTFGTAYAPSAGEPPVAVENLYLLRGQLGALRFWAFAPRIEELFPERYPRHPRAASARKAAAEWLFREQAGRIAQDRIGGIDARLSSSAMWSSLAATSELAFVANGAPIGTVTPYPAATGATSASQFALGLPTGFSGGAGLAGEIAQVSLWSIDRSLEAIGDTQFTPRTGNEPGLVACWNFADGGRDITGRGNDADPPVDPGRIAVSDSPISNEGPYVRNVYGGPETSYAVSAPGVLAVGQFSAADDVGTTRQRAALKRQFVFDPTQSFARPIEVGELGLTYIGQVQTDPTLIGYVEGAPPVPSENLTRPYYLSPGNPGYMKYLDTSTVTLVQEAASTISFASGSARLTQVDVAGAIGLFGVKAYQDMIVAPGGVGTAADLYQAKTVGQIRAVGSFEIASSENEALQGSWTAGQRDTMGFSGDWEPFQARPADYLNPTVGRRFVPDNLGFALVESLTADLYAVTFQSTGAAIGTLMLPNPSIPPDRNILLFPMNNTYTKAGTLDGRIGLVNDPDYPGADVTRGSYFKPVEAYALAESIDRARQRAESFAAQFDPAKRAIARNVDLSGARARLPQDFETDPGDAAMLATPTQGLVDRFVWTADGGLHRETQSTGASVTKSFTGRVATGGGGGFHLEGEFFAKVGFAWSLDVMATHRLDIQVEKSIGRQQTLGLEVAVEGEPFLRAFDPDAAGDYGGKGAFREGAAPGKVRSYRFMTFYLPPSVQNSRRFREIVDPVWLQLSNTPVAQALRATDTSAGAWRILHRVTFIERVPPPVASRPVVAPDVAIRAPVNVEGNVTLIRLVDAAIPPSEKSRSRIVIGAAVAAVLDPAPTAPGIYPPSKLEGIVTWWRPFLDRARPNASGVIADPAAAALLTALVERATNYCLAGYLSGAFDDILAKRPKSLPGVL